EATPRNDGKPSQEFYLDSGRLKNKVQLASGFNDEEILKLLTDCSGFRKLVHSIGVSVKSESDSTGTVGFILQNWGKTNIYETGTRVSATCPKDGTEIIIDLENYPWSPEDDVPGKIGFEFDKPGDMAVATVRLYLNDGYEVPEITTEPPVDFDTEEYKQMISKSLLNIGNNKRLKAAIEKAKRGEDVTVAYIGGSITQGAGAKPINMNCYPYLSYLQFKEKFGKNGGENVHFVKAGVGGTPSELGMIRYDRDILRDGTVEPDIVIVEFAVNDAGDETQGDCFESLCLKILSAPNKPAVIILFSVFLNDWNLQDRLAPVGYHYDLPMVSVKDAVVDQFKLAKEQGNIISKRQYFFDVYHPTNDGHKVMADCISILFSEVDKSLIDKEDISTDKKPAIGNSFINVHLIDRKDNTKLAKISEGGFTEVDKELQMVEIDANLLPSPEFPHSWMRTASSGADSFKMTITSKSLLIVSKDSGSTEIGKADVYVDGTYFKTLDPHENNWTHCNPVILYNEDTSREHNIEVKMAEGSEDKGFTILGFGYTL
ncbi:MAG TPA: SGNH/GDSL hydrolase family protein, partial [Mobilitalea sp.]|nr:SGNH/GDSL hydrolase family protein [Mobilitalea sp.]